MNDKGEPLADIYKRSPNHERRFTGRVKKIKVHGYLFIKPEPPIIGIRGYRPHEDVHANCESLETEGRPARVDEGTNVKFSLHKDENGFHAVNVRDENENLLAEPDDGWNEKKRKTPALEEVFEGTVESFRWGNGIGWIRPTIPLPASIAPRLSNQGLLFFVRDDIVSDDKVFGTNSGMPVKFQIAVDVEGPNNAPKVHACNITDIDGNPLVDQERPPQPEKRDNCKGQLAYFDKRKNVCYIKYQGKKYPIPVEQIVFEGGFQDDIKKDSRVEFTVEVTDGKKILSNVVMKNPRRRRMGGNNQRGRGNYQPMNSNAPDPRYFGMPPQQPNNFDPYGFSSGGMYGGYGGGLPGGNFGSTGNFGSGGSYFNSFGPSRY